MTMTINIDNVAQVYSGKQGRCCCGCSGKHTYSPNHRGYAPEYVQDNAKDWNQRTVELIVHKIERAAAEGRIEFVKPDYVSAVNENNTRVWIAYFAKPDPAFAERYRHLDIDEIRSRKLAEKKLEQVATDLAWERSAPTGLVN